MNRLIKNLPVIKNIFEYFDFNSQFRKSLIGCKTILDLGCGGESPFVAVAKNYYSVGVDTFLPSIEKSKELGVHDEYFNINVMSIDKYFKDKSFDCVIMIDLIEHLEKKPGELLLEKIEKIAKKKIIIFTPNGFLSQGIHYDNPWQEHKSGWSLKEMSSRGFKVIGFGGLKCLRSELANIKYKPLFFWKAISDFTELIVRNFPGIAFSILCIKEK
jgi:SAM-dependent methyltransferase